MSKTPAVIHLQPHGPTDTGLEEMELDAADFQSDLPRQQVHVYYEDVDLGLSVGVWTTTSMQEAFGPYPGDEFMVILEGQVSMLDAENNATLVSKGQTFCIRNAIPVSWKQEGFLRKFYMTFADPKAATPRIESAEGGVLTLDAELLQQKLFETDSTEPFQISGTQPVQRDHIVFSNDAENMFIGLWESSAFESDMLPFPYHEMVHLIEGEVTITEEDGSSQSFRDGDVFFIPKGTVCQWRTTSGLKKYYSMLESNA